MRRVGRSPLLVVVLSLSIGVVGFLGARKVVDGGTPAPGPGFLAIPAADRCPDSAREMTLDGARAAVSFDAYIPHSPSAKPSNVRHVCVLSVGTLFMVFPDAPTSASNESTLPPVRQPQILIMEDPWDGGDPEAVFAEDLKTNPDIGKSLCTVNKAPALCSTANSPSDAEAANPAFLRFVKGGVEITVSGGDDLERLIEIAESLNPVL